MGDGALSARDRCLQRFLALAARSCPVGSRAGTAPCAPRCGGSARGCRRSARTPSGYSCLRIGTRRGCVVPVERRQGRACDARRMPSGKWSTRSASSTFRLRLCGHQPLSSGPEFAASRSSAGATAGARRSACGHCSASSWRSPLEPVRRLRGGGCFTSCYPRTSRSSVPGPGSQVGMYPWWCLPSDGGRAAPYHQRVIKYLGSKRVLVPVLGEIAERGRRADCRRPVHRHDAGRPGVQAPRARGHRRPTSASLQRGAARLLHRHRRRTRSTRPRSGRARPAQRAARKPGYVTGTFCEQSRYFQPHNGARIDAIRDAIEARPPGGPLRRSCSPR